MIHSRFISNESIICNIQLADLSCLVYQKSTNTYAPYNKVTYTKHRHLSYCFALFPPFIDRTRIVIHNFIPPGLNLIEFAPSRIGFDNLLLPGLDQGEDLHPVAASGEQGKLEQSSWISPGFLLDFL